MRRAIIFGTSFAAILALAYLWPVLGSTVNGNGRAEAADTAAPKSAQPRLTLDPNQFVGPVKEAYKFAEKNPELLAQLHCYCGCDKAEGHQNLLDCYRSTHGASCEICTGEALLAKRMSEQGSPVDQIRNAIRRNFAQDN
jgi:hypothetical protein